MTVVGALTTVTKLEVTVGVVVTSDVFTVGSQLCPWRSHLEVSKVVSEIAGSPRYEVTIVVVTSLVVVYCVVPYRVTEGTWGQSSAMVGGNQYCWDGYLYQQRGMSGSRIKATRSFPVFRQSL